jgi:acyl-CoA reductase-like NAD-dependent aldehyde dehydrogenase
VAEPVLRCVCVCVCVMAAIQVQRRFVDKAASIRLGDPADLDTQMGPLISQVS